MPQTNDGQKRSNRGFAAMDQQKQREIASKGGQAAHKQGTAHQFTSEEARLAGQKGGLSRGKKAAALAQAVVQQEQKPEVQEVVVARDIPEYNACLTTERSA